MGSKAGVGGVTGAWGVRECGEGRRVDLGVGRCHGERELGRDPQFTRGKVAPHSGEITEL